MWLIEKIQAIMPVMISETRQAINPMRALEDPVFQEDLESLRIKTLGELDPDRWRLRPTRFKGVTNSAQLIEFLGQQPGKAVPLDSLTKCIYGTDSPDNRKLLAATVTEVRNKLEDPTVLKRIPEVGIGLGIERFKVTPHTLALLYRAWQNIGSFVSIEEFSKAVYGDTDKRSLLDTRRHARSLANWCIPESSAQLDGAYIGDRHYLRLIDKKSAKKYRNKGHYLEYPDFPKHLQPALQNWLINYLRVPEIAGDDQLALSVRPQNWARERSTFTPEEQKIAELLARFPYHVIPNEMMAKVVLKEPLPEDWVGQMNIRASVMRTKLRPGISIYRHEDIGWSIGVSDVGVSRLELIALSELWENYQNGVKVGDLAKRLYGRSEDSDQDNARAIVDKLKKDTEDTNYKIAFLYSLVNRSEFTPALVANQNVIKDAA